MKLVGICGKKLRTLNRSQKKKRKNKKSPVPYIFYKKSSSTVKGKTNEIANLAKT